MTNNRAINQNYQAYLVRFTWVSNRKQWLTTLKDIQSGQEHHFSDICQALNFLEERLTQHPTLEPFDVVNNPHQIL